MKLKKRASCAPVSSAAGRGVGLQCYVGLCACERLMGPGAPRPPPLPPPVTDTRSQGGPLPQVLLCKVAARSGRARQRSPKAVSPELGFVGKPSCGGCSIPIQRRLMRELELADLWCQLCPVGKDGLTGHCGPGPCNAPARPSPLASGSLFWLWLCFVSVLHRLEKGPRWHGLPHRRLGVGVQSGRGPCSPLGFRGTWHVSQERDRVAQARAQGARSLVTVPGPGCWPWWRRVALGHRKETSIVSVWPLGTWW